jgi:hypothetical protein
MLLITTKVVGGIQEIDRKPEFWSTTWEECVEFVGISLEEGYYQIDTENFIHYSNSIIRHSIVLSRYQASMFLIKGDIQVWLLIGDISKPGNEVWLLFSVNKEDMLDPFTMIYHEMLDELRNFIIDIQRQHLKLKTRLGL